MISNDVIYQKKIQFEDALLEIMERMPYNQISIVHLINAVGVSRKTFYRYFPDKDACLYSLIQRHICDCALYTACHVSPDMLLSQSYAIQLHYWKEDWRFLSALYRNGLFHILHREMMNHIRTEEKDLMHGLCSPNGEFDEDCLFFYVAGVCRMMTVWCENDFETPLEEISQKLGRLLHMPLIPMESQRLSAK